ncbi:patatin-like phospholipase family protein [Ferdinandcohnia quinoae]|uniref:Patatin family protein n=1 Tax=Fredinandcohnia quinoae TaxID=2918902 RepID=A0AAW5EDX1_9BACI|nr:patatin family protein [Fredinandcohnia sp. SECRCQ15]MCH1626964.1 patatin family protein [Fredinandcohnia sp. SECRCQ15]
MQAVKDVGLVLEGGGMRGVYTAGILEFFMEQKIYIPYVIGVSAGACMAASYLSRQKGRNRIVNIDYVNNPEYLSVRNYIKQKQLFGMDYIFDEIPNKHVPYDYQTFFESEEEFVIGTTDCETGEPYYFRKADYENDMLTVIRASSSLPFVAPIVEYQGKKLLDGGISDPIPLKKSQQDGNTKNIVVLTRNRGYFKKKSNMIWMVKRKYKQYPQLAKAMAERYIRYNETIKYLEQEEKEGRVFILSPTSPLEVGRIERNPVKLTNLYELGYQDASRLFNDFQEWLYK